MAKPPPQRPLFFFAANFSVKVYANTDRRRSRTSLLAAICGLVLYAARKLGRWLGSNVGE